MLAQGGTITPLIVISQFSATRSIWSSAMSERKTIATLVKGFRQASVESISAAFHPATYCDLHSMRGQVERSGIHIFDTTTRHGTARKRDCPNCGRQLVRRRSQHRSRVY